MNTSLKPTRLNQINVGLSMSAESWARNAIGGNKIAGPEGFENFRSAGGWNYNVHYRHISKSKPEWSKLKAVEEMSEVRMSLVQDIVHYAKEIDSMVMRLQRMEEQMNHVLPKKNICRGQL